MTKGEILMKGCPQLSDKEINEMNKLFPAMIFRNHKKKEVWTTCCYHHEIFSKRDLKEDWKKQEVMNATHYKEIPYWKEEMNSACSIAFCPFCGNFVRVKELGRTGKRQNLARWKRAVVLKWYKGALWARAYDCYKDYSYESSFTAKPQYSLRCIYKFKPGLAQQVLWDYYMGRPADCILKQDGPLLNGKWAISNPFPNNFEYGTGFDIIGAEEIDKSPLKYCGFKTYDRPWDLLKFLTAGCIYPRQIEMLIKSGMKEQVADLVCRGVKNNDILNWEAEKPKDFFRNCNKAEIKEFLAGKRDLNILRIYTKCDKQISFSQAAEYSVMLRREDVKEAFSFTQKHKIPFKKFLKYYKEQKDKHPRGGIYIFAYEDYFEAAKLLGYPVYRSDVMFPANLPQAHDEATKKHRKILKQKQREAAAEAYKERKEKLLKKYEYSADGIKICVPNLAEEIIEEGENLRHCVAGYADRHMRGDTTILFMRKEKTPESSWITIEMNGNKIRQIHGYKNERIASYKGEFAPDPRKVHKDFLDTWLKWLKKGSPRDKDGKPKTGRKKGVKAA